jgi:hypothetical protein
MGMTERNRQIRLEVERRVLLATAAVTFVYAMVLSLFVYMMTEELRRAYDSIEEMRETVEGHRIVMETRPYDHHCPPLN